MIKANLKGRNKSLQNLKMDLSCYGISENRFFESEVKSIGNISLFDFGQKYSLRIPQLTFKKKNDDLVIFTIENFETPYNDPLCDFNSYKKVQTKFELSKVFKEKFELKTFIKGRLLNTVKRGFSVGVSGVVAFLPLSSVIKVNKDKSGIFYIESINLQEEIVVLSQKNVHKKTHKVLLKLASRILFIFESNSKIK